MSTCLGRKDYKGQEESFRGDDYVHCILWLWFHRYIHLSNIKLYTLNIYSLLHQFYLNKAVLKSLVKIYESHLVLSDISINLPLKSGLIYTFK